MGTKMTFSFWNNAFLLLLITLHKSSSSVESFANWDTIPFSPSRHGTTETRAAGTMTSTSRRRRAMTSRHDNIRAKLTLVDTTTSDGQANLLPTSVYSTIENGRIAVIPNFLSEQDVLPLRADAQGLWTDGKFSTDALSSYGSAETFDPAKDRAVLRLNNWKSDLGDNASRQRLGALMASVRKELAYNLDRPELDRGMATTMYGYGSTEISYTRFGPGAFLKRHVDEHHEELKGVAGWSKPTRRSISWLIYLNDRRWSGTQDGGQLRCFERKCRPTGRIGSTINGDLQIGWLRATSSDPNERPVYLDAKTHDHGQCAMYIVDERKGARTYVTKSFETNPILYVQGSEMLVKQLLFIDRGADFADRFTVVEQPKSRLASIFSGGNDYRGQGESPARDEELEDVDPRGGTLVLFDSVSLPHEVLATKTRERWACSGWFHEDQQPLWVIV
jgi:Rps23 Pro-64 3,4-dihydroxylase Tpa1-like proline 4-hydroxylase